MAVHALRAGKARIHAAANTPALDKQFAAIRNEDGLRGLTPEQFAERAAEHISELNAIHPFREGNGRTQRAFLMVLGERAGHPVALPLIEAQAWNDASRASFLTGDATLMRGVIAAAIGAELTNWASGTRGGT